MKKITKHLSLGLVLIVAMLAATACGHEHTWTEATCDTPRTCSECGETEGEALGHDWMEATCESPKTCSRCGKTEGEALEHQWIEASFEAPQTCSLCGATMGEKYDYEIEEYELYYVDEESISTKVKVKEFCGDLLDLEIRGKTTSPNGESMYLVRSTWDEHDEFGSTTTLDTLISYKDGKYNGIKSGRELGAEWSEPNGNGSCYLPFYLVKPNSKIDIEACIVNFDSNGYMKELLVYDSQFNKVKEIHPPEGKYKDGGYNIASCNFSIWNSSDDSVPAIYYDDDYNEIQVDFKDEECTRIKENGNWSYATYQFDDVYFVGNDDKWGYVDGTGKELAMYMDATEFNKDGYAFVSNDRKSYDLIDKNFNVLSEDAIEGNGMSLYGSVYFQVQRDTDKELGELFACRLAKINIVGGPGDGVITPGEVPQNSEAEATETDSNDSNDDTSAEETASAEAADYPEGTIIFDWNPEEFAFLGHTLNKGIVSEIKKEYGFPEGADYLEKEFENGYIISASQSSYTETRGDEEKEIIQNNISIRDKDYDISLSVTEGPESVRIGVNCNNESKIDEANELAKKYLTIPMGYGKEDEVEEIFHVHEIIDNSGFTSISGLPFESNLEGSKITASTSESEEYESYWYSIDVGDYSVELSSSSSYPVGKDWFSCSVSLNGIN